MRFQDLTKKYITGEQTITALNKVNFDLPECGLVSITGKSGCGKTTLLYVAAGLLSADEGTVCDSGIELTALSEKELDDYRNTNIGIIFQDYKLLEGRTVRANLEPVLDIQKVKAHEDRIKNALEAVELKGFENRKVSELSGGQKQRVAIARALVKDCRIILADEPTGNLDENNSREIWKLLKQISKSKLVVAVTHDKNTAGKVSDVIIEMSDGKIVNSDAGKHEENDKIIVTTDKTTREFTWHETSDFYRFVIDSCKMKHDYKASFDISTVSVRTDEIEDRNIEKAAGSNKMSENEIKNLSLRTVTSFAMDSIKKRFIRHLLTSFMLSLVLLITYVLFMLYNWNCYESIERYLVKDRVPYAFFRINSEYTDFLGNVNNHWVEKGLPLYECLEQYFGENCVFSADTAYCSKLNDTIHIIYADDLSCVKINGCWAQSESETVVSDYIADALGLDIGSEFEINNTKYSVCGVFDTAFQNEDFKKTLHSVKKDGDFDYKLHTECFAVVMSKECRNAKMQKTEILPLMCSDFFETEKLSTYVSTEILYGLADICKDNLIVGRMPQDENEIIVSKNYYETRTGTTSENWKECKFSFKDILNPEYNNFYSCYMNLFDLYPNGIKIVGLFEDDEITPHVGVQGNMWEKIVGQYTECFACEELGVMFYENEENIDKAMKNMTLIDEMPAALRMIYLYKDIGLFKFFILGILIICVAVAILMGVNCISMSVRDSAATIGILRALGVRKRGTFGIFFTEMGYILTCALVMATVWIAISLYAINNSFKLNNSGEIFNLFDLRVGGMLVMYAIVFVFGILLVLFPINELGRRKPAELIRENYVN